MEALQVCTGCSVRSRERLCLCRVSMVMLIPSGGNQLLPGGEMLFSSHLPTSSESRLGCFWLRSDPSCEQRGLGRNRPCGISPNEVFIKPREAGVRGCGCLQSEEVDLESMCQPSVLPPWLSPSAQSWRNLVSPRLLELGALSKVTLSAAFNGKAAYAGGTGESVASSSFSVIIPLSGMKRAASLLPGSLCICLCLPQPCWLLLEPF